MVAVIVILHILQKEKTEAQRGQLTHLLFPGD